MTARPQTDDADLYERERAGEPVTHVRRAHRHHDDIAIERRRASDRAWILRNQGVPM